MSFWSLSSSHFFVTNWLDKEPKLAETPFIGQTLRVLLFQMQNFSFRSHVGPCADTANLFFFLSSFTFRFLSGSPLLSLFLPNFLFSGPLILMGKESGEVFIRIIGLNRKKVQVGNGKRFWSNVRVNFSCFSSSWLYWAYFFRCSVLDRSSAILSSDSR